MRSAKRKLGLVCLTALASAGVLLALHTLFVLEPLNPSWLPALRPVERDMADITAEGVLRVAFCRDEIAYAADNGGPHGLAYDLAWRVAKRLGVDLQPVVVANASAGLRDVLRGKADVLAVIDAGPQPAADSQKIAWTNPFESSAPVLVGKGAGDLRSITDLRRRTIAVQKNSAYEELAVRWQARLGGDLRLERLPIVMTQREIAQGAARGAFPLVLMDQDRARLESSFFEGLEVSAPLDQALPVRWAVRPNSPQLARLTSKLLQEMRTVGMVADLERRYLENPDRLHELRRAQDPQEPHGPSLTPFDGLFQQAASEQGLDWRLLAAISHAESRHQSVVGIGGALGLMQLMPETAKAFGADDPMDPAQNIGAGARHLRWLYDLFRSVHDPDQRLAFSVASYNIGIAHIEDARALAAARGLDADRWTGNVEEVMPLLDDPKMAEQLEHGQAHGTLTRDYVANVLGVFQAYTGASKPALAAAKISSGS